MTAGVLIALPLAFVALGSVVAFAVTVAFTAGALRFYSVRDLCAEFVSMLR